MVIQATPLLSSHSPAKTAGYNVLHARTLFPESTVIYTFLYILMEYSHLYWQLSSSLCFNSPFEGHRRVLLDELDENNSQWGETVWFVCDQDRIYS